MAIIDVSRWNGWIDWPRVRAEGYVIQVIIRCTMGGAGVDERFAENWRETAWAGILKRSPYHYQTTGQSGPEQLENILRVTRGDFGNSKFVVDAERTKAEREAMANGWVFPKSRYTDQLGFVCYGLRAEGAKVRIYSNKWEWETITTQPAWAAEFGFHVAAYPFNPNDTTYRPLIPRPWTNWEMWQYSATGRVPGIAGAVDLNRLSNDELLGHETATGLSGIINRATQILRLTEQ